MEGKEDRSNDVGFGNQPHQDKETSLLRSVQRQSIIEAFKLVKTINYISCPSLFQVVYYHLPETALSCLQFLWLDT